MPISLIQKTKNKVDKKKKKEKLDTDLVLAG